MRHVLVLLAASTIVAQGQFTELRAPGDGSTLYYSLSIPHPVPGNDTRTQPQSIYRIASGPATLFVGMPERGWRPTDAFGFGKLTEFYRASLPQLSADGTVLAITWSRDCPGRNGECMTQPLSRTTVVVNGKPASEFDGFGLLSANGRFLWHAGVGGFAKLADLAADSDTPVLRSPVDSSGARVVSDQGRVIVRGFPYEDAGITAVDGWEPCTDARGEQIVYVAEDRRSVRILRRPARSERVLVEGNGEFRRAMLSADGRRAMFLSTVTFGLNLPPGAAQLYAIDSDGSNFRDLTSVTEPAGVREYTMSDDGLAAWYVTADAAIVKVDLHGSGEPVRTVFHPAPVDLAAALVPGSATILQGANLPGSAAVTLDGRPVPVLSVTSATLVFLTPADLPLKTVRLGVTLADGRTAEADLLPFDDNPRLLAFPTCVPGLDRCSYPTSGASGVHQDWNSLVDGNSAVPGEIVHYYGVGLKPGTAPVCSLPLLYAGPAPGLPGFFQLDVQTPLSLNFNLPGEQAFVKLDCGVQLEAAYYVRKP